MLYFAMRASRAVSHCGIAHAVPGRLHARACRASCAQIESSECTAHLANGELRLQVESHSVAATSISVVRPTVDNVLDWFFDSEQARNANDPYWAEIWASALAVAQVIAADSSLVKGKIVAELGSGLGVAGLFAAKQGAKQVKLLDCEPKALQCALLTAAASGVQTAESASDFSQSEVEAEALQRFAQSLQSQAATDNSIEGEKSGTISAAVFDWNDDFVGDQYDVVIACDVLYETLAPEALARLLPTMLAGPAEDGRRILLTDPQDRTPKHRENFFKLLARNDPSIVCEWVKTIEVEHPTASGAPVKVISLRRRIATDTIGLPLSSIQ